MVSSIKYPLKYAKPFEPGSPGRPFTPLGPGSPVVLEVPAMFEFQI